MDYSGDTIIGMLDDDATMAGALPDTELAGVVDTLSETPLAYSDHTGTIPITDYEPSGRTRWWPVAALVAVILAVTGGAAGVILWLGHHQEPDVGNPTATTISGPTDPADAAFIADLRAHRFPLDDWEYTVSLAQGACDTITQNAGYPPGPHTIGLLRGDLGESHPDWTAAQLYRFTVASVDSYCPTMWGPTQEEIAAMPRADRYLKTMETELGITMTTREAALRTADQVCTGVHRGVSFDVLVDEFLRAARPAEWKRDDAMSYVQVTRDVYCNND